jgi:hypothetical protein
MNQSAAIDGARIVAGKCLVFLFLALTALAATAAEIWYEDNNLGKAAGTPADFIEKFRRPDTFKEATRHIRVYLVRGVVLDRTDDAFLRDLLGPYLQQNNIKLAINSGGANWIQHPGRRRILERELNVLNRLKKLGIEVHYLSLQSVLSKPVGRQDKRVDYPTEKRIADVITYTRLAREIFPKVEIGIIDALPSHAKDFRQPYRELRDALAQDGAKLAYVHLDMPFELPREGRRGITWEKVREVEDYVESLGMRFGFFTTSRQGGNVSSKAFHERVMAALECFAGAGGTPGDLIIASWFRYPDKTIPETAGGDDYPAMRTVLEYGRRLRQIETGVTPPVTAPEQWRALCTA